MPMLDDLKSQLMDLLRKIGIGSKAEAETAEPPAADDSEPEKPAS